MLGLIDIGTQSAIKNRNLSKMVAELSPYLSEFEIDQLVSLLNDLAYSKYDVNYTVEDAARQIAMTIGRQRYEAAKARWAIKNQTMLQPLIDRGAVRKRYLHISTGNIYDGLDVDDNPKDYEAFYG